MSLCGSGCRPAEICDVGGTRLAYHPCWIVENVAAKNNPDQRLLCLAVVFLVGMVIYVVPRSTTPTFARFLPSSLFMSTRSSARRVWGHIICNAACNETAEM